MSSEPAANYGVYQATLDGAPAVVTVDLNACQGEPDPTRPILARVRAPLQHPLPNGLRAQEELEAIGQLEGRLTALLRRTVQARFVGSLCTDAAMVFAYYAAAEPTGPSNLGDGWEPYELGFNHQPDPDWKYVRDFLAPNDWQQVFIRHLRVIYALAQEGDAGEAPRPVDHAAVFPTPDAGDDAAAVLRDQGFEVEPPTKGDDGFVLRFRRTEPVAGAFADEVIRPVFEIVVAHGGRYDAWGAPVVRG